ncbi:MAG: ribosome-binding protein aMBF1 (putative translation factor) [Verrucomicrobiales bacterium]|jgi:ribosome-binding protein aMBF1 (putative translation factor)
MSSPQSPPILSQRASADRMLSRKQLADRWSVSKETIKRREREGLLQPIRFNQRLLRYRLADILELEASLES